MARPKKQTVDYFPHDCDASEGRTLTIVESKYGNDGYAFWFKLLQLLGKTPGHYYDFNAPADWEFLLAKTRVEEDMANSILTTLVELDAIDRELISQKIIWCQHFVDNVADVYKRREVDLPTRPGGGLPEVNQGLIQAVDTFDKLGDKISDMIKHYEEGIGKTLTPTDFERLKDFADTYPDGWFEKAVEEVKNSKEPIKAPMRYIEKIMENWLKEQKPPESSGNNEGMTEA